MINKNKTFFVRLTDLDTWDEDAYATLLNDDKIREDYEIPEDWKPMNAFDDEIHVAGIPDFCIEEEISVKYLFDFYLTCRELGLDHIPNDIMKARGLTS